MEKLSYRQIFAALLSGLLLFAASPGVIGLAPIAWVALAPLLFAISRRGTSPGQAAFLGLISGLSYYPLMLYWITIVLGRYGHLPLWLSIAALLLLALYMSLYLAGFAALTCRYYLRYSLLWIAPTVWVALDFIRSWLFTGFPWFDLAYTQYQSPLFIQIADITGHHGISFMIVMVNTLIFHAFVNYRKQGTVKSGSNFSFRAALILVAAILSYNLIKYGMVDKHLAQVNDLGVAVVQGNINQDQKWLPPVQRQTVNKYLTLSGQIIGSHQPDLVVWPETALPFYLAENVFLNDIITLAKSSPELTILTGALHREKSSENSPTKYFNSAFFIDSTGLKKERYDKQHLVPFGEYIPLKRVLPFLAPLVETLADFTPGRDHKPITCRKTRVGVLICFESIFPNLARQQTKAGAEFLVNLTNDAWYGKSSAPWQHLAMAVFRAVENRRSLARAANTGVSVFIDPLGRMHQQSPLFEDFTGYWELPITNLKSVFTFYGGHFTGLLCLVITVLLAVPANRTNKLEY